MRRLVERNVHGLLARWFRRRHWTGLTLPGPFRTVIRYWLLDDETAPDPVFRQHELRHAFQADRWGWLGFWARYLWGLRRGYRANPLEVEARKAAGQPE